MSHETTFSEADILARLASELPGWDYHDGMLRRHYKTAGWPHTLMLVNAVGYLAEAAFHHPDLAVSYAMVNVKLMTHSAKGITEKDFELAKKIEKAVTWLPDADSSLEGFEKGFGKKWTR